MRKRKIVKIDDREITIKELTVREIIKLGDKLGDLDKGDTSEKEGTTLEVIKESLGKHLSMGVEGVTIEDMIDMAPSDLDAMYHAFKEVNKVFFVVAQQAGIADLLRSVKDTIRRDFLKSLAA